MITPTPFDKIMLRADYYNTEEGTLSNIFIQKNAVTFDVTRSVDRPWRVVCVKISQREYKVSASSIYYSDILEKTAKEELVMVDKIILPSNEVF